MRGCLWWGLYSLVVCVSALPTPRLGMKRCDCSPWKVCPMYPEPPRGRVTLGWAAVARPAAGRRLSVRGFHWCLVCECFQLLYRRPGLQAAICCVRKCGRTWAKDSSSSLFPGNSHFLPKSRSWSSGVVSQTNVDMQKSLRNCLGHLKHETCPNPM